MQPTDATFSIARGERERGGESYSTTRFYDVLLCLRNGCRAIHHPFGKKEKSLERFCGFSSNLAVLNGIRKEEEEDGLNLNGLDVDERRRSVMQKDRTRSHGQRIAEVKFSALPSPLREICRAFKSLLARLPFHIFFFARTLSLVFHPPSIILRNSPLARESPSESILFLFFARSSSRLHFSMLTKLRGTRSPGRDRLECLFEASACVFVLRCTHEIPFFLRRTSVSSISSFRRSSFVRYYRRLLVPRRRFLTCANKRICFSIGARDGKTTLTAVFSLLRPIQTSDNGIRSSLGKRLIIARGCKVWRIRPRDDRVWTRSMKFGKCGTIKGVFHRRE